MGTRPATVSGVLTDAIWIDHQQHVGIGDLPFISTSDKLTVGGTISGTHIVASGSVTAPTGTFDTSLTISGVPVSTGTSGGGDISYIEVSASNLVSSQSTTYVLVVDMTSTPAAGTYFVTFSSSIQGTAAGQDLNIALFHDGSIVAHTERDADFDSEVGASEDLHYPVQTQAVLTVDGSQVVEVKQKSSEGLANMAVFERSLTLLKLS